MDTIENNNREKALLEVKMYQSNDWDLKEETPEYFLLTRSKATTFGHFVVFFFTAWWTLGIGNIFYWYFSKEKKKIVK